jgi:hypothetical protein
MATEGSEEQARRHFAVHGDGCEFISNAQGVLLSMDLQRSAM